MCLLILCCHQLRGPSCEAQALDLEECLLAHAPKPNEELVDLGRGHLDVSSPPYWSDLRLRSFMDDRSALPLESCECLNLARAIWLARHPVWLGRYTHTVALREVGPKEWLESFLILAERTPRGSALMTWASTPVRPAHRLKELPRVLGWFCQLRVHYQVLKRKQGL